MSRTDAQRVIDAHSAYEITNEQRDEIMRDFTALTEIYSAVIDQLTIVEVTAIEMSVFEERASMSDAPKIISSELLYLVDVSECEDSADIRAQMDLEFVRALKFSTIEQVRALLVQLAITVSY